LSEITLEKLLAAQSHLGHATSLWNPANSKYIFGIRDGIHIIALDQTAEHLRRAAKVVRLVSANAGLILFVGSRKGQERSVVDAATKANGYHVFDRWIPGTLTNSKHILGHTHLAVVDQLDRRIEGFEPQLISYKTVLPDLVVCLNPHENDSLLRECAQLTIPTIGIIDTNTNPAWVTYQIPANDDR
jgi:small subunit ribosomal protein S2